MEIVTKAIGAVIVVIGLAAVICAFIAFPVIWLWNGIVPELFGLKSITFWQALSLALLCSLLFKSSSSTKS